MAKSTKKSSSKIVTMDRRKGTDRREKQVVKVEAEVRGAEPRATERRKKKQRRRQIDPTTCERDYSLEEIQFMQAMDGYKHRTGNRFPTCAEVLAVITEIGYVCDTELCDAEEEFADALEDYKQSSGRMFPTCSEILEVIIRLGYRLPATGEQLVWCGGDREREPSLPN